MGKSWDLSEDRISLLPDEVLLSIISLLTLKELIMTSVLSSRWLNLWMNTPVLDFRDISHFGLQPFDHQRCQKFVGWVNPILRLHKGRYLKKFKIVCHLNNSFREEIDRWLEFALARKVESLKLNFLVSGCAVLGCFNYGLPDSWKSNLEGRIGRFDLKFLKSLSLKNVNASGEAINSFLLNCPFLERLKVVGNYGLVYLAISHPTLALKYLQIQSCYRFQLLILSNFNLVSLDTSAENFDLVDLPMLAELSITWWFDNISRTLSLAPPYLSQLEALTLEAFDLKDVTHLSNLAQLTKLKRLVIKLTTYDNRSVTGLLSFMESCRCLQEFVLEMMWFCPKRSVGIMREVESLSCKNKSLKVFEFKGYYGRVSDVEFVKHVVENAPSLEKIIIETWDIKMRRYKSPKYSIEQEARRVALKQIEDLKESKDIPPHVDVLIR